MRDQIKRAIQPLLGMPLWASGRAADLEWFAFGPRRVVTDARGKTKEVGEYALHLQCAWRIREGEQVVIGSRDLYSPANEDTERPEEFNWDVQGANRRDKKIAELFQNNSRQFVVTGLEVAQAGSFTLILDDQYFLEVFPYDSSPDEHWRIFRPYVDEPHFVVSGSGILDA